MFHRTQLDCEREVQNRAVWSRFVRDHGQRGDFQLSWGVVLYVIPSDEPTLMSCEFLVDFSVELHHRVWDHCRYVWPSIDRSLHLLPCPRTTCQSWAAIRGIIQERICSGVMQGQAGWAHSVSVCGGRRQGWWWLKVSLVSRPPFLVRLMYLLGFASPFVLDAVTWSGCSSHPCRRV